MTSEVFELKKKMEVMEAKQEEKKEVLKVEQLKLKAKYKDLIIDDGEKYITSQKKSMKRLREEIERLQCLESNCLGKRKNEEEEDRLRSEIRKRVRIEEEERMKVKDEIEQRVRKSASKV